MVTTATRSQTRAPGYAELHCHTNFSFLDGASHPEELVEEAARLGLAGLATTDHDGLYGVVRAAVAARPLGLPTVFGAELTLGTTAPANGVADPPGEHLLVLAEGPRGYAALARAISEAQLRGGKGAPRTSLAELGANDAAGRDWFVLTGCRKGPVPAALLADGPAAARTRLDTLVAQHPVVGHALDRIGGRIGWPGARGRSDAAFRRRLRRTELVVASGGSGSSSGRDSTISLRGLPSARRPKR